MFTSLWEKRKIKIKLKLHTLHAFMKIVILWEMKMKMKYQAPLLMRGWTTNEFACNS